MIDNDDILIEYGNIEYRIFIDYGINIIKIDVFFYFP